MMPNIYIDFSCLVQLQARTRWLPYANIVVINVIHYKYTFLTTFLLHQKQYTINIRDECQEEREQRRTHMARGHNIWCDTMYDLTIEMFINKVGYRSVVSQIEIT